METKDLGRDPRCRTNRWGVDLAYEDALGQWHETPPESEADIRSAMGETALGNDPDAALGGEDEADPVMVTHADEPRHVGGRGVLTLESGEMREIDQLIPPGLPHGYHRLTLEEGREVTVIVAPRSCYLPDDLRTWGWSVQLYAARSRESWGIGDFGDLLRLAKWSKEQGQAGMMLLNPLWAATPVKPLQCSPYYPTTRLFLNPLWVNILALRNLLPGERKDWEAIEELDREGRQLNENRLIDRDRAYRLKNAALEILWKRFAGAGAFERFAEEHGRSLHRFATFCALAERYGSGRHSWPQEFQHPDSPAVAEFAREGAERIRFHKWVQWLLDQQLAEAATVLDLMQDLPIGVDPDGADAWAWQDVLAQGAGVGAPPDEFNTQGQDWGLPPFVPHKLRKAGYRPFVETIRAAFRHCRALRIDHVMGLFRLFWVPWNRRPAEGAYVRYNEDEMLSIVALESERAKAYVVGEDLGTVEEGAREKLAAFGILSYRLLWFEKDQPSNYPVNALAAVTTHDLPTVAGLWTGSDLERQKELGLKPNDESTQEIHERLCQQAALPHSASLPDVAAGAYRLLSSAPCRVLAASLDDALTVEERPNIPATNGDQNPNWSLALPAPIEEVMESALARKIAMVLGARNKMAV